MRNKLSNKTNKISNLSKIVELIENQLKNLGHLMLKKRPEAIVHKDGECQPQDQPKSFK